MSTKNDKHPGLVPLPGSEASLGISWNPPGNAEILRQAKELGVYRHVSNPAHPSHVTTVQAKLEEMQRRLSPSIVYEDLAADAYIYATTEADGTINRRRISRTELEAQHGGAIGPVGTKPWSSYDKLRMRLGLVQGDQFGCHINIYEGPNSVFVFVATDDKALILEDAVSLFPSDSLIGQFRLWQESIA